MRSVEDLLKVPFQAPDSTEKFLIKSANVNSSEETCEVPDIIMNIYSKDIDITKQNSRHKI